MSEHCSKIWRLCVLYQTNCDVWVRKLGLSAYVLQWSCVCVSSQPSTPSRPPLPRCPGFCLLNIMAAFCERPSVLIAHTSNCQRGSVCCDNTRGHHNNGVASGVTPSKPRPRPKPPSTTSTTTTTTPAPPDDRLDCPGSCIVSYLSFTCFSKFINLKMVLWAIFS